MAVTTPDTVQWISASAGGVWLTQTDKTICRLENSYGLQDPILPGTWDCIGGVKDFMHGLMDM